MTREFVATALKDNVPQRKLFLRAVSNCCFPSKASTGRAICLHKNTRGSISLDRVYCDTGVTKY